jgi:sulfonate transport system substrate-binding protein
LSLPGKPGKMAITVAHGDADPGGSMKLTMAFLTALIGLAGTAGAEPLKIRIAWTTVPGQMTPILFEDRALAKHRGTSYELEHFRYAGSGPMVTALGAGEVDIAPLAPSSLGVAIQNAQMHDIRVITDDYQDGVPGYYSGEFLVRKDSPIAVVPELKGKVITVNAVGGGSDLAMRMMLRRYGLEDRKDYTVVETQFNNMGAMLEERKADLAALVLPFSYTLMQRGTVRSLFTMRDILGTTQSLANVARAGFLEKNRAQLADFFEDYVRGIRWFLDPANRVAAVQKIADFNKQPASIYLPYLFTTEDYYRDANARPDLDALQHNMRTQREFGFLNADIDVQRYTDLSFIDAAIQRLK